MRLGPTLALCAALFSMLSSSAWAIPQCQDEPTLFEVRGWSASGDRVALYREVYQACVHGVRSSVLEVYQRGRPRAVACFDGFAPDPSVPVPCDAVTYIDSEAWGGASVSAKFIPLPEGFVAAERSLSARGATVWTTDGETSTAYELEVFPPDPAPPATVPLPTIPMERDPWTDDGELQAKAVSVSVSVVPAGDWAVALLEVTEYDDDLEYVDMIWTEVELPEKVRLAAPNDPTVLEPSDVRCAPEDSDADAEPVSRALWRAPAKARVYQRVGDTARAFSILTDATNTQPGFVLGWAGLLDVALASSGTGRASSIVRRLRTSCPALADEVLQAPRFEAIRPPATPAPKAGR